MDTKPQNLTTSHPHHLTTSLSNTQHPTPNTMPSPLTSLKILDFTTLLPGPYATMILADLGADVIRIEAPNRVDLVRSMPPFDGDQSAWHSLLNRNKRSLALDLKEPEAVEIVHRLVQSYDIVVESFRPGVMDRLGVGYSSLSAINPRLIYCTITSYGQTGPLADRAAHDLNSLALAGVFQHTGRADSDPLPLGVQIADIGSSHNAVIGILAAAIQRLQDGQGQYIDISMFDSALAWNALAAANYLVGGEQPQREAMPLNGGGFYDLYRTADGRHLAVASLEPKFWQGFCQAIERIDLVGDGYNPDPAVQRQLKAAIQQTIAARPLVEWQAIFAQLDVCVEPVLNADEALAHPQTQARGMVVAVPKPDGSTQQQIGSPIRFSTSQPDYRFIGVSPGEHNDEILRVIVHPAIR
jgi:alpha-methylacyl-CoA racemase